MENDLEKSKPKDFKLLVRYRYADDPLYAEESVHHMYCNDYQLLEDRIDFIDCVIGTQFKPEVWRYRKRFIEFFKGRFLQMFSVEELN